MAIAVKQLIVNLMRCWIRTVEGMMRLTADGIRKLCVGIDLPHSQQSGGGHSHGGQCFRILEYDNVLPQYIRQNLTPEFSSGTTSDNNRLIVVFNTYIIKSGQWKIQSTIQRRKKRWSLLIITMILM